MLNNGNQMLKDMAQKICSECGQPLNDKVEHYLLECDYCLSKKPE